MTTKKRTGRPMTRRIRTRGWLRVESPLHVGGLGHNPAEVLPTAFDGQGNVYVPGTTLAGVLRAWTRGSSTAKDDTDPLSGLWGYAKQGSQEGRASRVIVRDAVVASAATVDLDGRPAAPLGAADLDIRPSVGIDRVTGTAAPEILYFHTVIPAGHLIRLEIDVEVDSDEALDRARLGAMLRALAARRIRVGAASGRGLGAVRLLDDPLDIVIDRFDSPEGLLAVLRGDPSRAVPLAGLTGEHQLPEPRRTLTVQVDWEPLAPVMVRSGADGLLVDTLPLTTRIDDHHVTLVLPGGTIKGALRTHAELIERTARRLDAPFAGATGKDAPEHSQAFRRQLDQLPAVRALFGSARGTRTEAKGWAGALRAEECAATIVIPVDLWQAATGRPEPDHADGAALPETVRERLADLGMEQADHVAIDRWTGGAAEGLLFSVLEPHDVAWEPLRLTVDLNRLADQEGDASIALLLLVLRDLEAGRVPLGANTNRGFGDIKVTGITFTGDRWNGASLADALADADLDRAWQSYLTPEDPE